MRKLSERYQENVEYFKETLSEKENFDLICREICIGKDKASFFYIDGFTKDGVMQRLFQYFIGLKEMGSGENAAESFACKHIPYVEVDVSDDWETLTTMVLSGASVMLGETFGKKAIVIDSRTYPARTTAEPDSDRVMQGAHDGFVETLIFNTALIRRRIRDPRLVMHYENLGGGSRTDLIVCYIKGKADQKYVDWLIGKVRSVRPESVTMGAESLAECLIRRRWYNPFPKIRYLERPDAAAAELMEGRVLLLCDNSPQVMVLPTTIFDFMQETDDFYFPPVTGCYLRVLRHLVFALALFLIPAWYLIVQNQALLPEWMEIFVPRETGKIPLLLQIYLAEVAIDGLKLASMNTPNMLTNSLSVIGGLILGEFAVGIGWLSADVIFYMAIVAIAGFTQQNRELGYAVKLLRMLWLAFTALFHIWGFVLVGVAIPILIATNQTLNGGKSYLYPLIPFNPKALFRLFFRMKKTDVTQSPYPDKINKSEKTG
ncbi:MAG: spore germination protein [Clostridia bacterium]|nr:spore germination protein [Clostridia bacterium]